MCLLLPCRKEANGNKALLIFPKKINFRCDQVRFYVVKCIFAMKIIVNQMALEITMTKNVVLCRCHPKICWWCVAKWVNFKLYYLRGCSMHFQFLFCWWWWVWSGVCMDVHQMCVYVWRREYLSILSFIIIRVNVGNL